MTYFIIAGRTDCKSFSHAVYVANFLSTRLPDFKVKIIDKNPSEWKIWLREINMKNKWYHQNSPLIWKELTMSGGKAHIVGGLSEFWEYCYDYYGLISILSAEDIRRLSRDCIQYFSEEAGNRHKVPNKKKSITIFITGNQTQFLTVLVGEILHKTGIFKTYSVNVKMFNQSTDNTWQAISKDLTELSVMSVYVNFKFNIVSTLQDGLQSCDLLIITGDYSRRPNEDFYAWLMRNNHYMLELADKISSYASRDIRIIVAMYGPVCFNANILIETVTNIKIHNIVAVTSDIGLEVLNFVSKATNVPLKDLGAPPVWGCIGVNQLVDIEHITQRYDVYRPNNRAINSKAGSTLSQGETCTELRFLAYKVRNLNHMWQEIQKSKETVQEKLNRSAYLPKIRAIIGLLDSWYCKTSCGNIISLGIISDGSFGIPRSIVFSQPAIFENNRWVPMKAFPTPRNDPFSMKDLIPFVVDILHSFTIRN